MGLTEISINALTQRNSVYPYTPESQDELLLEGCLKENRLAQKYLYQRYAGVMLGICMRYAGSRDEAMEMLNAAFFRVFKSIHQFDGSGALKAWISKIVIHACIDWVRSQAAYRKRFVLGVTREAAINNGALEKLNEEDLLEKVQLLPPTSRLVFTLFVIEGYSHKEIAEVIDISVGTSKWHLSEARKRLKEMLKTERS